MTDFNGAPERIRTADPQIRSLVLYPAELRALLTLREGELEPKAIGTLVRRRSQGSSPTYLICHPRKGKAQPLFRRLSGARDPAPPPGREW